MTRDNRGTFHSRSIPVEVFQAAWATPNFVCQSRQDRAEFTWQANSTAAIDAFASNFTVAVSLNGERSVSRGDKKKRWNRLKNYGFPQSVLGYRIEETVRRSREGKPRSADQKLREGAREFSLMGSLVPSLTRIIISRIHFFFPRLHSTRDWPKVT